ncbi:MAG: hypothetical protein KKC68_02455 [Candidatus Thermoplasmatota archaeon]|nr:hypothetical protein [Candidatus Thermoplasmatota archaeon]MBU1940613.1 hypothetical protein [Candidatus Thermoplasmatota archaeon]
MIRELLRSMIREEWRVHTTIFGNRYFAFFPVVIGFLTCAGSLFVPFFLRVIRVDQLFLFAQYMFLLLGVSIGSFGLFGREIMNRRFGQASLIAYSARSLPVGERAIFTAFFLKDILFYLFFWIVPMFGGFVVMAPFIGFSVVSMLWACGTLSLSFLFGLAMIFLLSTVYAHSSRLVILLLFGVLLGNLGLVYVLGVEVNVLLLGYSLFYSHSLPMFIVMVVVIVVFVVLSIVFVRITYPEGKKYFHNQFVQLMKRFSFSSYAAFIAKDFIDLRRSEGGLGKLIFSFLLPMVFTYLFLEVFLEVIPAVKGLMIFAVFLGIVSASIYTMLTAFDTFNPYLFLPVRVSTIIKSKMQSFMLFNLLSVVVLGVVAVSLDQVGYFVPAFLMFMSICVYALAVTVYLTGLHPNILLYNTKVFIPYLGLVGSVLFAVTFFSILDPFSMLLSPVLIPIAYVLLKKSFVKWDQWVPQTI